MVTQIWEKLLTETDKKLIEFAGYGQRKGFGERPAFMIIDPQYNYMGAPKPILEQLDEYPSGCGENAWKAVPKIQKLLEVVREKKLPVIFTRNVQKDLSFDSFSTKAKRDNTQYIDGHKGTLIIEELAPRPGEIVLDKAYASAFFGTPLISILIKLKVDSLIICGGTISGCVRATIVDAVSRNYNVAVIADCVFDRVELSYKAALLDIWMKYADVIYAEEALKYFKEVGIKS
ncbi:MAG: isochorismatase family protein [Firmicutes bacterium]|nr:isochorismatase family protein [Bacillota bacterium]